MIILYIILFLTACGGIIWSSLQIWKRTTLFGNGIFGLTVFGIYAFLFGYKIIELIFK